MSMRKYESLYHKEKRGIHNVREDIFQLKQTKDHESIDSLSRYIDALYDSYNDWPFDPDEYFPSKVALNSAINAIIDNAQTAILLMERHLDPEYYFTNLTTILAICDNIKNIPWVRGGDEDAGVSFSEEGSEGDRGGDISGLHNEEK